MKKILETTTIGSFPKPAYVPVQDWFDFSRKTGGMSTSQTTLDYNQDIEINKFTHERLFIRAAQ